MNRSRASDWFRNRRMTLVRYWQVVDRLRELTRTCISVLNRISAQDCGCSEFKKSKLDAREILTILINDFSDGSFSNSHGDFNASSVCDGQQWCES